VRIYHRGVLRNISSMSSGMYRTQHNQHEKPLPHPPLHHHAVPANGRVAPAVNFRLAPIHLKPHKTYTREEAIAHNKARAQEAHTQSRQVEMLRKHNERARFESEHHRHYPPAAAHAHYHTPNSHQYVHRHSPPGHPIASAQYNAHHHAPPAITKRENAPLPV